MTKDHETEPDDLVERLENSRGWPNLGKAAAARIRADAEVIKAAKALRDDVLEVQAYRAQCAHGSVNLSALALKMKAVEETLAAFRQALQARAALEEKEDE